MSILTWIEDKKRLKVLNAPKQINSAPDSSKGLWTRCDKCGVILYIKHLKENQRVCFGCSYHLQMMSQERIENLLDKVPHERKASNMVSTWRPLDETVSPCDPLKFIDQKNYTDRLQDAQEKTGLQDAIQTGTGMIDGIPVALAVMDFSFMGGSMGSVVGEKITRLIEYATQEGLTLIIVSASGGARMQEGVFSLMQMAKISSALQIYQSCAKLLYISILTSPTTGGVTASFAMLGDIIFAEPKALIAFAGRRVIEQTLCEDLPDDFQTSEYMLHHGLVDLIVPRRFLRQALSESIKLYQNAPFKKIGRIPFGIQNPINFITEEKIRRQWNRVSKKDKNLKLFSDAEQEQKQHVLSKTSGVPYKSKICTHVQRASHCKAPLCKAELYKQRTWTPVCVGLQSSVLHESALKSASLQSGALYAKQGEEHGSNVVAEDQSINGALVGFDIIENEKNKKGKYREILTSFQTMLSLFSHQINEKYKSGTFFTCKAELCTRREGASPVCVQSAALYEPPSLNQHVLRKAPPCKERAFAYKVLGFCKPGQNDRLDFHTNKAYIHYVKGFLTKKKTRTNRILKGQVLQKANKRAHTKLIKDTRESFVLPLQGMRHAKRSFARNAPQGCAFLQSGALYAKQSKASLLTKRSFVRIIEKSDNQTELKKLYTGHVRPRSSTFLACKAELCTRREGASPCTYKFVRAYKSSICKESGKVYRDECKANVPLLINLCLERPIRSTFPFSELRFVTKQSTLASLDVLCMGRSCISGKRCKIDQRQNQNQNLQLRKAHFLQSGALLAPSYKAELCTHSRGVIRSISKIKHRFSTYELAFVPCLLTTRRFTQTIADARKQVLTNLSLGAHSSKRLTSFVLSNKVQRQSNSESFDQIYQQEQRPASKINPRSLDLSIKLSLNILNQALELAATESVEWRAFYMDQQLSESMMSNDNYLKDANVLFYRSILR